jgi:cell division protein FtsN
MMHMENHFRLSNTCYLILILIVLLSTGSCESKPEQYEPVLEEGSENVDIVQTEWPLEGETQNAKLVEETAIQEPAPPSLEILPPATIPKSSNSYYFQIGAFVNKKNADRLMQKLSNKGYHPYLKTSEFKNKKWNLVRVGAYSNKSEALKAARSFVEKEEMDAIVMMNNSVITSISGKKQQPSKKQPDQTSPQIHQTIARQMVTNSPKVPVAPSPQMATVAPGKSTGPYSFQIGGLFSSNNAKKQLIAFQNKGYAPYIVEIKDEISSEKWYSVRIGSYESLSDAVDAASKFTEKERIPAQARPLTK